MGFREDVGDPLDMEMMNFGYAQDTSGGQQHFFPGECSRSRPPFPRDTSRLGPSARPEQSSGAAHAERTVRRKCVRKRPPSSAEASGSQRKRKQVNRSGSIFVDDMAGVTGSDEEEEEDEETGHPKEYFRRNEKNLDNVGDAEKFYRPDPLSDSSEKGDDDDGDDDADYNHAAEKQKVHQHAQFSKFQETDDESTDMEDDMTISEEYPPLYMVKCQRGHELEAAVCLMQKFYDLKAVGKSLQLISVVALEHRKGCIYIEANHESHIKQACRGLPMIHTVRATVVPSSERVGVLSIGKSVNIHKDNWVRLKMGTYKGDLGKVLNVDTVKQRVTVKVVPRIDLREVYMRTFEKEASKSRQTRSRPEQCFIGIDEVKRLGIPVKLKRSREVGDVEEFSGIRIQDGYHVKDFSLNSVEIQDATPTLDDIQRFQKPGIGISSEMLLMRRSTKFAEGDEVVVEESGSQKVIGLVVKVQGDYVFVRPKGNISKAISRYEAKVVKKNFTIGEHVSVVSGKYQGETGMVVDIKENSVIVLSDTTREDLRVLRDCIAESFDVASVTSKLGDYVLDDLVLLDKATVGVIVEVSSDYFQILKGNPDRVEVVTLKPRDIIRRINDRQSAIQDSNMNMINIHNLVRVNEGPHKGRKGRVEHIYGTLVFLRDDHYIEKTRLVCIRARSCKTLGGFECIKSKMDSTCIENAFGQTDFRNSRRPYQSDEGSTRGPRRENDFVGKIAKIKAGRYKGYRGRVVNCKGATVLVYLDSQMRVVTVPRHEISVPEDQPLVRSAYDVESGNQNPSLNEDNADGIDDGNKGWGNDNDGWGNNAAQKDGNNWGNNEESQQWGKNGDGWGSNAAQEDENDWGNGQKAQHDSKDDGGWGNAVQNVGNDCGSNQEFGQGVKGDDGWGSNAAQKDENDWGNGIEEQHEGKDNGGWGGSAVQKVENDWGNKKESGQGAKDDNVWDSKAAQKDKNDWGNSQEAQHEGKNDGGWGGSAVQKVENDWGSNEASGQGAKGDDGWGAKAVQKDENDWGNSKEEQHEGKDDGGWGGSAVQKVQNDWGSNEASGQGAKGDDGWGGKAVQKDENDWGNSKEEQHEGKDDGGWGGSAVQKVENDCENNKKSGQGAKGDDGWGGKAVQKHKNDWGNSKEEQHEGKDDGGWGGGAVPKVENDRGKNKESGQGAKGDDNWGGKAAQRDNNDWGNSQEGEHEGKHCGGRSGSAVQTIDNDWGNNEESQQGAKGNDVWSSIAARKAENDRGNNRKAHQDEWAEGSSSKVDAMEDTKDWGYVEALQRREGCGGNPGLQHWDKDGDWGSNISQKEENDGVNVQESQQDGWRIAGSVKEKEFVDSCPSAKKSTWGGGVSPTRYDGSGAAAASKDSSGYGHESAGDTRNSAMKDKNDCSGEAPHNKNEWGSNREPQHWGKNGSWGSKGAEKDNNDWENIQESQQAGWTNTSSFKEKESIDFTSANKNAWGGTVTLKKVDGWHSATALGDGWGKADGSKNTGDASNNVQRVKSDWGGSGAQQEQFDWGNTKKSQQDGWVKGNVWEG